MAMNRRVLAALVSNLVLVGIIVLVFGLDWMAALYGDYRNPPAPRQDRGGTYFIYEGPATP